MPFYQLLYIYYIFKSSQPDARVSIINFSCLSWRQVKWENKHSQHRDILLRKKAGSIFI
jgi:hypothetical protein